MLLKSGMNKLEVFERNVCDKSWSCFLGDLEANQDHLRNKTINVHVNK